jgi:hypothetical protein
MPGILIAILIVAGGVWFFRQAGRMSPAEVRGFSTKVLGAGMMGLSALLALRGAVMLAVPLFAAGAGLFGLGKYLPQAIAMKGQASAPPPPEASSKMSVSEALAVLGLKQGAAREDVLAAHKRLQRTNHPDVGGSDYLAGKINQARDILLKT